MICRLSFNSAFYTHVQIANRIWIMWPRAWGHDAASEVIPRRVNFWNLGSVHEMLINAKPVSLLSCKLTKLQVLAYLSFLCAVNLLGLNSAIDSSINCISFNWRKLMWSSVFLNVFCITQGRLVDCNIRPQWHRIEASEVLSVPIHAP